MHIFIAGVLGRGGTRGAWRSWPGEFGAVAWVLLLIALAIPARAERPIGEILAERTREYMSLNLATALQARAIQLRGIEDSLLQPAMRHRYDRYYWGGCGGSRRLIVEPRVSKLPSDPMLVLGDSYLKCRVIRAALLEPAVSVASFPPGYFGDFEYEGLLVPDWIEFSDEAALQQLFMLLLEVAEAPEEEVDYYEWENQDLKLADYKKETGFVPELVVQLVGDAPLTAEINLTGGRLLIQTGDKWEFYSLDRVSAAGLKAIIRDRRAEVRLFSR